MDIDLHPLFRSALERFVEVERTNIASGVSERSLCARLAMILEPMAHERGLREYRADVEYNRGREGSVKVVVDERHQVVTVTCDLVLHGRGIVEPDNLIAVEMKRLSHRREAKDSDRVRLCAMTEPAREHIDCRTGRPLHHVSGYLVGYLVELQPRGGLRVETYRDGRLADHWTVGPVPLERPSGRRSASPRAAPEPDLFDEEAGRAPDR